MTATTQIWAEIDLQAIAANVNGLKALVGPKCDLMAVVKADGYGHGISEVSRVALKNGATALGVARPEEAVFLRQQGIMAPILILGYTPPESFADMLAFDISATIFSYEQAAALSAAAAGAGKRVRSHLKLDTGMGRLGITVAGSRGIDPESIRISEALAALPGLQLEGVYTHFATADSESKSGAKTQFALFQEFIRVLKEDGLQNLTRHAANSAAVIDMPETHLDMVRCGIAIYGLYPSAAVDRRQLALKPAMTLKTRIIQVKQVPEGFPVSYGATYKTDCPTTLAVVPAGYADGYNRQFSSCGRMLVAGQRVPVVGRVCMDLTVLDVGQLPSVSVGDEVVIFGAQGRERLDVADMAAQLGTISYEVISTITERVPRIYLQ